MPHHKLNSNSREGDRMNQDELLQHAARLERSVWRAVMAKDGAALGELFADDYIEITLTGKTVVCPPAMFVQASEQFGRIHLG